VKRRTLRRVMICRRVARVVARFAKARRFLRRPCRQGLRPCGQRRRPCRRTKTLVGRAQDLVGADAKLGRLEVGQRKPQSEHLAVGGEVIRRADRRMKASGWPRAPRERRIARGSDARHGRGRATRRAARPPKPSDKPPRSFDRAVPHERSPNPDCGTLRRASTRPRARRRGRSCSRSVGR